MTVITATESTPFVDEGVYFATVQSVEEQPSTTPGWADQFKFVFTLDGKFYDQGEKAGQPMDMWHYVSQKLTPKSNLWATAVALGVQPVLGQDLDTDQFFGKKAQLVVKHVDTATGPKAKIVDFLKSGRRGDLGEDAEPALSGCVVCARKGKRNPLDHYGANGEPLCPAHDDSDVLPGDRPAE